MKKNCAVALVTVLLSITALSATPLQTIMANAEEYSLDVKKAKLNYESNKLALQSSALEDKVALEVKSGDMSVSTYQVNNPLNAPKISVSPSVTVTLPNDGKTTMVGGMGFSAKTDGSLITYDPYASVSHTFDFGYKDDNFKAYTESYSSINTEKTYLTSLNSFRQSVLTQLQSVLTIEQSITKQEKTITDLEENISNNLELEVYSKTSTSYKKAMLDLSKAKATADSYKKQYANALSRYEAVVGSPWDGVTDLPTVVAEFTPSENGSSTVMLSSIAVSKAEEDLKLLQSSLKPNSLKLTGDASASNTNTTAYSITGGLGATYNIGNVAINSKLSGTYTTSKFYPTFTVGVTWKNNTTSEKDSISLQQKQNALVSAQNDYQQELLTYKDSVNSLYESILSYNASVDEYNINSEYLQTLLEYQTELKDAGLSTEKEVTDIEFDIEMSKIDYQLLQIKGLVLKLKIEAMNI